jgi:hypothetical protein
MGCAAHGRAAGYTPRLGAERLRWSRRPRESQGSPPARQGVQCPAPGEYRSEEFKPAFSFRVGKGWQTPDAAINETPERLIIESAQEVMGGTLLIFRNSPEAYDPQKQEWVNVNSYEDILSWFEDHPYLKTSNPEPVTVGGVEGVELETEVAKDSPEDEVQSFRYSDGFVASIDRGTQSRTIILDMKGEAVSIGVDFPRAQKVVDSVKWGGS